VTRAVAAEVIGCSVKW